MLSRILFLLALATLLILVLFDLKINCERKRIIIPGVEIYENIVNPHPFKYVIKPSNNFCDGNFGKNIFLLVVVNTNPKQSRNRQFIRNTWGKRTLFPDVRVLFLIGLKKKQHVNEKVRLEAGIYQDILQGSFHDSYRNLTHKGIMSLKWVTHNCYKIKYFLKTDEDMVINLFALLNHLKNHQYKNIHNTKTILCNHIQSNSMQVIRDKDNRWFLDPKEYALEWFSEYCSGCAYVITSDLLPKMYMVSKHVKFVWVDDFFMSGVLGTATNASYVSLDRFYEIFKHPKKILKEVQYNNTIHMFYHLQNIPARYYIWLSIVERSYIFYRMKYDFSDLDQKDFGLFDEFYWADDVANFWQKYLKNETNKQSTQASFQKNNLSNLLFNEDFYFMD